MKLFTGYVLEYLRGRGGRGLAELAAGALFFAASLCLFFVV